MATIIGTSGNDNLSGTAGNDSIVGLAGNDIINGLAGIDTMVGGQGNDIYYVDSTYDVITEGVYAGTDNVYADASYRLSAESSVENLFLRGSAYYGYGNGLDNYIAGNVGNNYLSGGAGNDTINGVAGNDTMVGSTGNDIYYVDSADDVVTEGVGTGIDSVYTSVSYGFSALFGGVSDHPSAHVENLYLQGSAYFGLGNALNNSIGGNAGNNLIWGGAGNDVINGAVGNDTMEGDVGNDTYYVDNSSDVVTEGVGAGTDTVYASANYTLSANVENLYLQGSAYYGAGNELNNSIVGNAGNNYLWGAAGNDNINGGAGNDTNIGGDGNDTIRGSAGSDVLTGSAGADYFTFNSAGEGIDTINDFSWQQGDKIVLSSSGFSSLQTPGGSLAPSEFGTRILYNSSTGALSFDRDGTGTVYGSVQIATLSTRPILISSDFQVIA
ncbi:calcium-binding protein [Microcoleus sp. FACHB-672]|uniref:calcium-binding protein n=1 Tax=Microcoleus sp. FACHB-672 TaxID=2692825 RepID=UPI0016885821|nr:calcium-binding protein [Microcoleus sp. FACHB-672]MBD2039337.1 calcium-binding protein [Microcoleus sp. FACHB-672]